MSFNNYFNIKRFSHLLKQDLLINRTKYLLSIIGLALITYLLSYWFLDRAKDSGRLYGSPNGSYFSCFVFYMMAVGVVIGTAFPDLGNQIKTSNYLLCPGSILEKLTVQFLLRIGLFVPIALGIFWITIRLAKASLTPGESGLDLSLIPYFEFRFLVSNYNNELYPIWNIFFVIFGFFSYGTYLFAGTTYFKRYALVKTVIVSGVLWGALMLFMMLLSHIFYPQVTHGFEIKLKDFAITEHLTSSQLFGSVLALFSWIFFLFISYFRLKEREA